MKVKARRGQILSSEMILGVMLFMISLGIMLDLWDSSMKGALESESLSDLNDAGVNAAETLVRTPGVPADWNSTDVTSLGLANESRVLEPGKVRELVHYMSTNESDLCITGTNYECNLHMLGLGGYDFLLNLSYLNGTTVNVNGTLAYVGRLPVNDTDSITVVRTTILNDQITRLYLTVWK